MTAELKNVSISSSVGCEEHCRELTKAVLGFFLTTSMFFVSKQRMRKLTNIQSKKKKGKSLLKQYCLNALQKSNEQDELQIDDPQPLKKKTVKRENL